MDTLELREIVERYHRIEKEEKRGDGSRTFVAWYAEVPGCMVEALSHDEALEELDALIGPFLEQIQADGGAVPAPLPDQPMVRTVVQRVNQLVLGDVQKLLNARHLAETESRNDVPSRFQRQEGAALV